METDMIVEDRRTPEEQDVYTVLIGGVDTALSGWGLAAGGKSYAYWACRPADVDIVMKWVLNRSDIKAPKAQSSNYRPRGTNGHVSIYVVRPGHPALNGA